MHERDKRSFGRFFLIFEASFTLASDSDFDCFRSFLRKFAELSSGNTSRDVDWKDDFSNRFKSVSVWDGFNDFARTSLIRSGWLFSMDREEGMCLLRVFDLHARAWGKEFGRTAKESCLDFSYVPPLLSSKNSSSSDEFILSSARDDCLESDWRKKTRLSRRKLFSVKCKPDSFAFSEVTSYSTRLPVDQNAAIVPVLPVRDYRYSAAIRYSSSPQFSRFPPCSSIRKSGA